MDSREDLGARSFSGGVSLRECRYCTRVSCLQDERWSLQMQSRDARGTDSTSEGTLQHSHDHDDASQGAAPCSAPGL
jgi:hypothetical protein